VIQRSPSISLILLCICLALQGCTSVKKTLGFERDAPNEFAVTPGNAPLEMPPDFFYLPTPEPGMERPQDRAARQVQAEKFLGSAQEKEALSTGQQNLLEMCDVQGNQESVRSEIDTAARMEVNKDSTIIEKLGITKEKPKDIVNPHEEKARLKKQQLSSGRHQVVPTSQQRHSRQRQKEGRRGTLSLTPEDLSPIEPEENLGNLGQ